MDFDICKVLQAKATCNSELIAIVMDLATVVDMLAMKVHLFETHHAKIEVGMELLFTKLLRVEEITNKIASAKIVEKVTIPIAIFDEEEASSVGGSGEGCNSKRSRCYKSLSRRPSSKGIGDRATQKTLAHRSLVTNWPQISQPPMGYTSARVLFLQPSQRFSPHGDLVKNGSIRGHGKSCLSTHSGLIQRAGTERSFPGDTGRANDGSSDRMKVFGSVMQKSPSQLLIGSKNSVTHVSLDQMKLPPKNSLTEPQRWAASYAFDTQKNSVEVLLSLTPGTIPVDNIFHMFAMMLTKYNNCMEGPTFWCLLPSFSTDIHQEKSVKQLVADYSKTWMKPSLTLNYVHLPIKEDSGQWYLMVIAFREGMLYYLDASTGEVEAMKRKSFIRKLGDDVAAIITESTYEEDFSTKAGCITCSGITAANNLSIAQTCETSAIFGSSTGWPWVAPSNAI
ncbi:FAR1 DNA-binding domain protein [Arachis hypogaea]|nr:FAR1 DNA-binding domain protein [Arachis hypogaea]